MDGQRFDRWTRSLAAASSRRGLLKGLAASISAGLVAAEVEETEAAQPCQTCRRGVCTLRADGTRCGTCGVCLDGACLAGVDACGSCKECSPTTFRCVNRSAGTACGECGTCRSGHCRPNDDACPSCAKCRPGGGGYTCQASCRNGDRCCRDSRCVAADACCSNETACHDDCCDTQTERCTADGCCAPARVCGSGADAHCCRPIDECLADGTCCPVGKVCRDAGIGLEQCCGPDEICCASDHRCKHPDKCCPTCSTCEECQDGQCVALADNAQCTDGSGVCCGGVCKTNATCCDDGGCPACGKCINNSCDRTAKNGQACGSTRCHVCDNGECVKRPNDAPCTSGGGLCCEGVCCSGSGSCCSGQCCNGPCPFGVCCAIGFTAATAPELCCPFGPPCGAGGAARCCNEGETCCGDTCCVLGLCDESGTACCPVARSCEDECCAEDLVCTLDGCLCPNGSPRCPATGSCCGQFEECSTTGCCDDRVDEPCCLDVAIDGTCNGPCCSGETEHCCFTFVEAPGGGFVRDDVWCCPQGNDCNKHGCCPPDFPRFNFRPNDPETYCCPEGGNKPDLSDCITTVLPGRRS